ncbi:MAG: phosphoadenylyl-sulfate reductase [Hyphomonas sp.]
MPLLKETQEAANRWTYAGEDGALGEGAVTLPLARFLAEAEALAGRNAPIGVRLQPDDDPAALVPFLDILGLIEISFPQYTDGRGYSQAQLLRRRHGYRGELRAVGQVLRDQIFYMHRSGFDAFETARAGLPSVVEALEEVRDAYQPAADGKVPVFRQRLKKTEPMPNTNVVALAEESIEGRRARLNEELRNASAAEILRVAIKREWAGELTYVSSFGSESVALLALIAEVDPGLPVLFLDTGMHFPQTLDYRDEVIAHLGLTGVRTIRPSETEARVLDPKGQLWKTDTDACCGLRKVRPLEPALEGFSAWINGRKRFHGGDRLNLPAVEFSGGRYKINPLAGWTGEDVDAFIRERNLPRHPLVSQGYPSIGCWPCTRPAEDPEDPRSGRWAGQDKTECGLHVEKQARPRVF